MRKILSLVLLLTLAPLVWANGYGAGAIPRLRAPRAYAPIRTFDVGVDGGSCGVDTLSQLTTSQTYYSQQLRTFPSYSPGYGLSPGLIFRAPSYYPGLSLNLGIGRFPHGHGGHIPRLPGGHHRR